MNNTIKYSVIIPVYNSEKTIARCLESLTAQNRDDVQIIVVNDGSRDGSEDVPSFATAIRHLKDEPALRE